MKNKLSQQTVSLAFAGLVLTASTALAEKKYDVGVTDTEIKIGQTMPYSGPGSAYGTIGKSEVAYLKMINDQGGINGRKINLVSLEDPYTPPHTVEQIRKLVHEEVLVDQHQPDGLLPDRAGAATPFRR